MAHREDATTDRRMNLKQVARALDVHYMTAYRYVRQGRLPAVQAGNVWLVEPDDVAALAQDHAPSGTGRDRGRHRAAARRRPSAGVTGGADRPGVETAVDWAGRFGDRLRRRRGRRLDGRLAGPGQRPHAAALLPRADQRVDGDHRRRRGRRPPDRGRPVHRRPRPPSGSAPASAPGSAAGAARGTVVLGAPAGEHPPADRRQP